MAVENASTILASALLKLDRAITEDIIIPNSPTAKRFSHDSEVSVKTLSIHLSPGMNSLYFGNSFTCNVLKKKSIIIFFPEK